MDLEKALVLLASRPEVVNVFPDWLLPRGLLHELEDTEGVAIAEIAGRDGFAAVLAAVDEYPIRAVLPTIAYTGTEFGDWRPLIDKCLRFSEELSGQGVRVFAPVLLGAPRFWWTLSGRYVSTLFCRFGFYTPCLGCHLYLHALRIPLARLVRASWIISGERERRDGHIEVNQVGVALDAYTRFAQGFGVTLLLPLRYIDDGKRIERILGSDWQEGAEKLDCVLRGNYQYVDGRVACNEEAVLRFLEEFALPVAEDIVRAYLASKAPAYGNVLRPRAARVFNRSTGVLEPVHQFPGRI
jgi:hypothetical protein